MTDYYVAATGSDTNAGTLAAPWKTVNRVNTGCSNGSLKLKDNVYFKRGDTFYGKLRTPGAYGLGGVAALDPAGVGWLHIGAYGDDPNLPILSGYKILNTAAGWVQHDANTWKLDGSAANVGVTYTGCSAASEYIEPDVGFLKVDGVIKGFKRATLAELVNQWDFYSTGTTVYVRSTAKPTTLAADIRGSYDLDGIYLTAGVEIVDLIVEGYGACAVYAPRATIGGGRGRVVGCELRELGGSYMDNSTVRYGNGITVWGNGKDLHFEKNVVHDVYDAAYSIQGSGTTPFTNIMWRRNLTYRCCQAEEYAYFSGTGPGFVNCRAEYNTNLFAGYGFGGDTRADSQSRVGLQSYQWGDDGSNYTADIVSRRNVYYDCRNAYAQHARVPLGLQTDFNHILLRAGTQIQQGIPDWKIENPAPWLAYSGREQHSKFVPLAADTKTDITDADVRAGYDALETYVSRTSGQPAGGNAVLPIHKPWAA